MNTPTAQLADRLTGRSAEQVPDDQVQQAKRLLLDYLGVALAGSRSESGRIAGDYVAQVGGVAQARVIGRRDIVVPTSQAAFANAIAEHSIELDDIDEDALFHYGPPVVSAALAVGEARAATGRELVRAIVAGCEAMSRVSRATNHDLRDRGFHTTPTCGVFGAAVSAAVLMGLSPSETTSALGLAGAQASGLMEMYGPSMQKRFNPGPAARNGVVAAEMAAAGFTGSDSILEGERGFGRAFAGRIDEETLLDGLGAWIPVTVEHKPYSAARPIHNAIDCALDIRARAVLSPDQIDSIVVRRHPTWSEYHRNSAPATFHEAQVSLPYAVAAALSFGSALPPDFRDELLGRADLVALMSKTSIVTVEGLARGVSCQLVVTYRDGSSLTSLVDDPLGSVGNPMSWDALVLKFRSLTEGVLSQSTANRVVELVTELERQADVSALLDCVTADVTGP